MRVKQALSQLPVPQRLSAREPVGRTIANGVPRPLSAKYQLIMSRPARDPLTSTCEVTLLISFAMGSSAVIDFRFQPA